MVGVKWIEKGWIKKVWMEWNGLRKYGWGEKKVMNKEKSTEKGWDKKVWNGEKRIENGWIEKVWVG